MFNPVNTCIISSSTCGARALPLSGLLMVTVATPTSFYYANSLIFVTTISASFSSDKLSRSTDLPATTIHFRASFVSSGFCAQADEQPQINTPISVRSFDCSAVKMESGASNFSIFWTSLFLSIDGLQPPQYFTNIIFAITLRTRLDKVGYLPLTQSHTRFSV